MNFSVIGNLWILGEKKFFGRLYLICHIHLISWIYTLDDVPFCPGGICDRFPGGYIQVTLPDFHG